MQQYKKNKKKAWIRYRPTHRGTFCRDKKINKYEIRTPKDKKIRTCTPMIKMHSGAFFALSCALASGFTVPPRPVSLFLCCSFGRGLLLQEERFSVELRHVQYFHIGIAVKIVKNFILSLCVMDALSYLLMPRRILRIIILCPFGLGLQKKRDQLSNPSIIPHIPMVVVYGSCSRLSLPGQGSWLNFQQTTVSSRSVCTVLKTKDPENSAHDTMFSLL